jgi:hypothetical protein
VLRKGLCEQRLQGWDSGGNDSEASGIVEGRREVLTQETTQSCLYFVTFLCPPGLACLMLQQKAWLLFLLLSPACHLTIGQVALNSGFTGLP